tara:strand:+ start:1184 stop:1717 length:534 start_codon:yes stop_codon:yes gene_type:complete
MSEEAKVATETVSEETTQEATTDTTDVGALIAESKKYRKRSQDAEARLATLESQLAKAEEAKLKEKEDFKTLYEKTAGEMETYKSQADKWTSYEAAKRDTLLNSVPENEREAMSKLDLETLEYVTNKINASKANAPEVVGNTRTVNNIPDDWTTMDRKDAKANWADILANAAKKTKN